MKKRARKIIITAILYIIALFLNNIWIKDIVFVISYIIIGYSILKKAIRNVFRGKVFDENFLMAVATIGAFTIKEFPEAVTVMLFYQVGELFQSYAVDKSRKSISSLMDIRPDYANIVKDGKEEKIEPDEAKIGDIIIDMRNLDDKADIYEQRRYELKRICNQEGFNNIFHLQSENDNIKNNNHNKKLNQKKGGIEII